MFKTHEKGVALVIFLLASLPAFAQPAVFMIPGSGSSGPDLYFNGLGDLPQKLGIGHYFGKFQEELTRHNVNNFVCPQTQDHDQRTLEERADECVQQILTYENIKKCDENSPREIVLFGHSMGGLIGRLVAQDPRVRDCIRSATSISTPHHGTPFADVDVDHTTADETHFDLLGKLIEMSGFVPKTLRYLPELRTDRSRANPSVFHAQDIADNPAVQYFSFTNSMGFIPMIPLEIGREWMNHELKARHLDETSFGNRNDGVVPEFSMVHGTNLGHIETYHWASSCEDTVKFTRECARSLHVVIPHLVQQAQRR